MTKRFILHVGLPKCASTSIQDTLVHARSLTYLGKTTGGSFADPLIAEFVRVISVFGDTRLRNCLPHMEAFDRLVSESTHEFVWLSDELLSSVGFAAYGQSNSLPQIIENFKRAVPVPVEPVIVVRQQERFLKSYYRQWVQWGSSESYEEFIRLLLLRRDRFLFPVLNYVNLVRVLRNMAPRVHVICFEALTSDPEYRRAKLAAIGAGDIADLLGTTHSRAAESDEEIASRVAKRHPVHFVSNWNWLARSQYPDLYAYRPVTTQIGRSVMSFLRNTEKTMQAAGAVEKRRHDLTGRDLFYLDDDLAATLKGHIARINKEIESLDPEVDWRAHGY